MMVMSSSCFTLRINRMLFFVSTILLAIALARPTGLTPAQEGTLSENGNADKLSVAYARATKLFNCRAGGRLWPIDRWVH
jgi:hypothetical protein